MTLRARLGKLEAERMAEVCLCPITILNGPDDSPPILPDGRCPDCGLPVDGIKAIIAIGPGTTSST